MMLSILPLKLISPEKLSRFGRGGFDKIGQNCPRACLDECLYRHPGQKFQPLQLRNFLERSGDMNEIVSRATLLVLDGITGDPDYAPIDLWSRTLNEGRKSKHCGLADLYLVDALRRKLHLDREVVRLQHDQHRGFACGDHAANRVHVQLVHHTSLGRASFGAHELVFSGDFALPAILP